MNENGPSVSPPDSTDATIQPDAKKDQPDATTQDVSINVVEFIRRVHKNTVLGRLEMDFDSLDPECVSVSTRVDERLFQPGGVVHGGIYVLLAESVASTASALRVDMRVKNVSGLEINANHLRPTTSGWLCARAEAVHVGNTTHVYRVDVRNYEHGVPNVLTCDDIAAASSRAQANRDAFETGRLVSVCRCTIAIRDHGAPHGLG